MLEIDQGPKVRNNIKERNLERNQVGSTYNLFYKNTAPSAECKRSLITGMPFANMI